MKKKGRKVKNTSKALNEIIGVLIFAFGAISCLSLYFTKYSGLIGKGFKSLFSGLFGLSAYILPFLIMILGILVIISYKKNINRKRAIASATSLLVLLSIIHLCFFSYYDKTGFFQYIDSSYKQGMAGRGTGVFPAIITYITYSLFGLPGSFVVLISLFVITLLLLTKLSLKQFFKAVYVFIKSKRNKSKIRINTPNRKEKPFIGEVINIDDNMPDQGNGIRLLEEAFSESEPEPQASDNIKIIHFDESNNTNGISSTTDEGDLKNGADDITFEIDVKASQLSFPYMTPPITLLKTPKKKKSNVVQEKQFIDSAKLLEETLNSFGVSAKVMQISKGPVITRYELQPARGVKVSSIVKLADDIALNLAAQGVRIEAPIPGKAAVGIEVPNKDIAPVLLREVLDTDNFINHQSKIAFALGKDIAGNNIIADIGKMPHLLIAGATGSGKSVCINSLIISILYKATPEQVKLIMIDPKVVELNNYNGIPHLMIPVVTDPKKAAGALNWAVQEMTNRYKIFADKGVRDFERYNELVADEGSDALLPQIIVIIDELADLMMIAPGDVEDAICRLAQMARAAGIHLVIATQRPSVDVITGIIKANIPSRIAFAVSSQVDSRTILDMAGAEKLLGRGDMLYYPVGASKPIRVQGTYISEKEVEAVVSCIKNQNSAPEYNQDVLEEIAANTENNADDSYDELLPDAIELVIDAGQASISMLQRRLRVGYARAARMIDEMEVRGIVSGFNGSKTRNVLMSKDEFIQQFKAN